MLIKNLSKHEPVKSASKLYPTLLITTFVKSCRLHIIFSVEHVIFINKKKETKCYNTIRKKCRFCSNAWLQIRKGER